jgi:hypothetical protein
MLKSKQRIAASAHERWPPSVICRSQEKTEEAIMLLKESIKYGPDFADAYSSLASLLAEQVIVSI